MTRHSNMRKRIGVSGAGGCELLGRTDCTGAAVSLRRSGEQTKSGQPIERSEHR
jgi:hypothetical protein